MAPSDNPEFDWLLVRLRAVLAEKKGHARPPVEPVPGNPDWKRLLEFARWHVLGPSLAASVADAPPGDGVPDEVWAALRADYAANAAQAARLTAELPSLVDGLQAAGVRALPFKAPALAARFYPDTRARKCENINLLVEPSALRPASVCLARRGYHFVPVLKVGAAAQWHIEANVRFRRAGTPLEVCLHAQVVPRRYSYRLPFDRLWQHARRSSRAGLDLPWLSNEHWLILASLYSSKDGFWPSLGLVYDLAWVLADADGIDWERLRREARRLNCERVVLLALALVHRLLGAELPGVWRGRIESDPVVTALRERVCARLARQESGFATLPDAIRTHYVLRRNFLDKVRYAAGVLATPSVRDFSLFGRPVPVPMSYAVRAVTLAGKCGWQVAGKFVPVHTRRPVAVPSVDCGL
ncbi:MAG: nucleotidyltransferase family protein [Gluconacetobacter diazotrophicus]|nr:nucleotidyltransferase family protein [Gluconacetobacter diazotrophicus]